MTLKILLVEDNELSRDMLTLRLQKRGYEVITATDGEQAIAMAESGVPDLILMDISLPVMNGWEATKKIKAHHHIPIIALTANARKEDEDRSLAAGCDDYDTKPIDMERLLKKITGLMMKNTP